MERVDPAQYDDGAAKFVAHMESQPYNVLYERPAMRSLVGDVAGLDVLDVACGAGSLIVDMVDGGAASVVGCDASGEMLRLARERVPADVELHHHDCCKPFDWAATSSFDLVTMSLAYHYLNDPGAFLAEAARVLRPDGAMVISTHHPTDDWRRLDGSYFSVGVVVDHWRKIAQDVAAWRMPLTTMTAQFRDAGFLIDRLVEPLPLDEMEAVSPDSYTALHDCPAFILFRLVKR